jgi:hypothetical protein
VKVKVRVQRRAEAVDENHCAQPGRGAAPWTVLTQTALDRAQQNAHDHALQHRIVVQKVAQPLGHGKDPLPQRQRRLCSEAGSFITGADLQATGGRHL